MNECMKKSDTWMELWCKRPLELQTKKAHSQILKHIKNAVSNVLTIIIKIVLVHPNLST